MRVILRADATPESGTGHIMRLWALAEEFAKRGCDVVWQATVTVPWVADALSTSGWSVLPSDGTPVDQAVVAVEGEASLVVVDSYSLGATYRKGLVDRGVPVVAIRDDSRADLGPASMWVNPGVAVREPPTLNAPFLNGPDYVLIRSEIRVLANLRRQAFEDGSIGQNLTLLLGGTDFAGLGSAVAGLRLNQMSVHHVFAGPARSPRSGSVVSWLGGGPTLLQQAALSRLVVSAAGVSSWEMLHIGVPLALVLAADNQRGNYGWMTTQGGAKGLGAAGELRAPERLSRAVSAAWKDAWAGRLTGSSRIDGLGAARVVEAALELL